MSDDAGRDETAGPDLGSLLGGEGGLGGLLEQAQKMAEAHAAAAETVLEGVAGGGAVRITANGHGEFRSVSIDPAAVDASDVEMLEDLVLAALHDLSAHVGEVQRQAMGGLSIDSLGGLLPGASDG